LPCCNHCSKVSIVTGRVYPSSAAHSRIVRQTAVTYKMYSYLSLSDCSRLATRFSNFSRSRIRRSSTRLISRHKSSVRPEASCSAKSAAFSLRSRKYLVIEPISQNSSETVSLDNNAKGPSVRTPTPIKNFQAESNTPTHSLKLSTNLLSSLQYVNHTVAKS